MSDAAQKIFVQKFLDWERVRERLAKYPNIRSQFPEEILSHCSCKGPYYCHYLAWRLGVWEGEEFFEYFDRLLENGISIKNWQSKKSQIKNCDFDEFWGLIWELQVASFFHQAKKLDVEWTTSGPDLKVNTAEGLLYVECYTYRKSFPLLGFIEELFTQIDPHLKVKHGLFLPLEIQKNIEKTDFLNALFHPFLSPDFLANKLAEAIREYPVSIKIDGYSQIENVYFYVEGDDSKAYSSVQDFLIGAGEPKCYLGVALREALNNKRNSNLISQHRPNLLAVNYLLSLDYQTALSLRKMRQDMFPSLGEEYDAVLLVAMGIDGKITDNSLHMGIKEGISHPIKEIINNFTFYELPENT